MSTIETLVEKWIRDEKQYRDQVAEARKVNTPWVGMMAHADQLAACRREAQEAFWLVKRNK